MSAAAAILERPTAPAPCPQPVPQVANEADTVRALRARGIRVYPDLSRGTGVDIVDDFEAGWGEFRPILRARRRELFLHLLGSYWPQEAGLLAVYARYQERGIARAIRRCLELRGAWRAEVWTRARVGRLVQDCQARADRYPELYVSLGFGSCTAGAWFPLNEQVAYTILEAGGTPDEALAVLIARNERRQMRFTPTLLASQVEDAAYLLAAPDEGYGRLACSVLERRTPWPE